MKIRLNKELPRNVVKAVLKRRISKLDATEKLLAERIMKVFEGAGIWDWYGHYPLMPTGSLEEMLAGKTLPLVDENYILHLRYHATISKSTREERTQRLVLTFPQYFQPC